MGNYSKYTLLLGVKLDLQERVIETNPDWNGVEDKDTPQYVLSSISEDEYLEMSDTVVQDERYAYGEKEIERGYVFPNGQIASNLVENGTFAYDHRCDLSKLCFIENDNWLGEEQLFGLALLHNSTSDGYRPGDEQKLLTALNNKTKLAKMINKYGFDFKPEEDMQLHQYIMEEG